MKKEEIRKLLDRYFEAEATVEEEARLADYFMAGSVEEEFLPYTRYFRGVAEAAGIHANKEIEENVMNFIHEQESEGKNRHRWLWQVVTGIAASVLIVISGYLFYENRQEPFKDTFENPEQAYAYASSTIQFVSSKYNRGMVQLASFSKIEEASLPLKKGLKPLGDFLKNIEKMEKESSINYNH